MLSDEELIDGLQSALATLQPRSDLIACVRERAAADQPRDLPSRPTRRPRSLPAFSAVVAIACVVVALAIGGGALVLLSGHHPSGLRAPPLHRSRRRRTRRAARGAAAHSPSALPAAGQPSELTPTGAGLRDLARETTLLAAARAGLKADVDSSHVERRRSRIRVLTAAAFATCMRANGVPDFPDPQPGGGDLFEIPAGANPAAPAFRAAGMPELLPNSAGPAPAPALRTDTGETAQDRGAYARDRVPEFPDPRTSIPANATGIQEIGEISTGRSCSSRPRSTCSPRHTGRL